MKNFLFYLLSFSLSLGTCSVFAQGTGNADACRTIEIHCKCENSTQDFVIPRQKVGKTNPTQPGLCWSSKDIDTLLTNTPMVYCMKDKEMEKDPTKPQTKCTATWTCKEPCTPTASIKKSE